jgi:DNA polymerase III delta prime subunit
MKKINTNEFLYVEKYRPQTVDDLIAPVDVRERIKAWIETDGQIPNLGFFSNNPGTGKSSIAKSILKDLDADFLFINASKENGIDLVRNKIYIFASNVSFEGRPKIVVLDEADGCSTDLQKGFRAFIEEFSQNCRFILTGNYSNKIIEPILNRLIVFDFDVLFNKHSKEIAKQIFDRLCFILDNEKVEYEKDALKPLITTLYPSIRRMINILQESVTDHKLVLNTSLIEAQTKFQNLLDEIKNKRFDKCRALISEINSPTAFYNFVYKNMDKYFMLESLPHVVILTHHFMNSNVNSRDPDISMAAYCASMIRNIEIKFQP